MKYLVWGLVVLLLVVRQDFWLWNDRTLVFGFMPIGLLYHSAISLCAGLVWFLAILFCWPSHLEEEAEAHVAADSPPPAA